jgi:hypothetical protein
MAAKKAPAKSKRTRHSAQHRPKPPSSPKKMGRPTLYSPEIVAEILEWLSMGWGLASWCKGHHVDDHLIKDPDERARVRAGRAEERPAYRTVRTWIRENESFQRAYVLAHEDGTDYKVDEMEDVARDPDMDADQKRVRISTTQWIAVRRNRKLYGDRVDIGQPDALDDDQRMAAIAALIAKGTGKKLVESAARVLEKMGVKVE